MKPVALISLSLLFTISVLAEEATAPPATELVRLMRADEYLREGAVAALSRATRDGYYTKAQFDCFAKLSPSTFTPDLADFASRQFTPAELDEALAFYRSPAGKSFVDYIFAMLGQEFGPEFTARVGPAPALSIEEMREVKDFSSKGIGKRLAYDMVLIRSPESQDLTKRMLEKRLNACGAKIPR
jgi:hypothetical protein